MINNVIFSVISKKLERFILPMFTSFIKFNPDIPMYCIITDDVSDLVQVYLKHLGVHLIKHQPDSTTAKTPEKALMHLRLVIPDYIPNFNKVMCLDADMLIFDKILNLFDYSADIVAHGGFDGKNWLEKTEADEPYIALGLCVMSYEASCRLRDLYRKHGELTGDDGDFIRKHLSDFNIHKIHTPMYNFCNILIEEAEYCKYSKRIFYIYNNEHYVPNVAHFTKCRVGRSRNVEIDKWCLDNGIQLRHETSG